MTNPELHPLTMAMPSSKGFLWDMPVTAVPDLTQLQHGIRQAAVEPHGKDFTYVL